MNKYTGATNLDKDDVRKLNRAARRKARASSDSRGGSTTKVHTPKARYRRKPKHGNPIDSALDDLHDEIVELDQEIADVMDCDEY